MQVKGIYLNFTPTRLEEFPINDAHRYVVAVAYQNRLIVGNLVSLQLQSYQIGLNARGEVFWVVLRSKGSAHHPPFSVGSTGTLHTEKVVLYTPQCFQPPPPKTEECSPSETRKWYWIRNDSLDKIKDQKVFLSFKTKVSWELNQWLIWLIDSCFVSLSLV